MTSSTESDDSSPFKSGLFGRLRTHQFKLSQRILFSWIRPTILGCDADNIGITEDDLVCYVMPYRSIADLLVVDKAAQQSDLPIPTNTIANLEARAFFFLGHPEGWIGRKTLRNQSERMLRLLDHQRNGKGNIKIVPVSLFWGHQPDREKSVFKFLLSENWSATSRFKKLLSAIFHGSHILVQFSEAIDLDALIKEEQDSAKQTRRLLRMLRSRFTGQKQAILGPDLSHRNTLISVMLDAEEVKQAISEEALRDQVSVQKVERRALSYANEIASDQSYRVVRFFHVLLTWLWNNLYQGIDVSGIDTAKNLAQTHEVIYIPCHRSHIDYLLLSYVLYHNGLTPPHIAAGKNLNLPIAGPLLRRGGAFFMRRSFRDDELYRAVFDEYLHQMFTRGYSVEYFIEGGRSRTGRTLVPRTGMLSMTLRSFARDSSKPIAFLPIYFGYERLIEARTYVGELSGREKKDESVLDMFGIFRSFSKPFGRVAVNFGEPLILDEFLEREFPDWNKSESALSESCVKLALDLAERINGAVAVTPINLLATALLTTPQQTMPETRLLGLIGVLQSIAFEAASGSRMTVNAQSPQQILEHATQVAQIEPGETPFGPIYKAEKTEAILLTYYQNNSLHVFAVASLIARMVKKSKFCTIHHLITNSEVLKAFLESEMMIDWGEDLPDKIRRTVTALQTLGLVDVQDEVVRIPATTSEQFALLTDLAEIIEPTFERFYIVTALLQQKVVSTKQLQTQASTIAQQLSTLYGLSAPEFFDPKLFAQFITALRNEHLIDNEVAVIDQVRFDQLVHVIQSHLDGDVSYNVLQAIEQSAHRHQNDSPSQIS